MQIILRKVTKTPLDFEVKSNEMTFKGFLQYHSGKLILLKAKLSGSLILSCSVCANEFKKNISEDVEFFISDGIYEDTSGTLVDVVEYLNSVVIIDELLDAEIELIKSDYNSCPECAN